MDSQTLLIHCAAKAEIEEIEIHGLDLRYLHTRVMNEFSVASMKRSLERFGQLSPLVATRGGMALIDGYRRVAALKLLGRDTAVVELWPSSNEEAILCLLARSRQREWEAIEQAALLREILSRGLTQADLARLIGKDPSWVRRRLDLIESLPEEVLHLIRSGHLSSWAASRVLAPLARANPDHGLALARWVANEGVSTRELASFLAHYRRSGHRIRERMVHQPSLFLKSARAKATEREAAQVQANWIAELKGVLKVLERMHSCDPKPWGPQERSLIWAIKAALHLLDQKMDDKTTTDSTQLQGKEVDHDPATNTRCNPCPPPEANLDPQDRHDP